MSEIKIIKTDGTTVSIPEANLENFRRLNGGSIKEVLYENTQSYEEILDEIENEDVVERITAPIIEIHDLRKEELMSSDKDVLRKLADEIALRLKITKVHQASGVEKLADFIIKNS